MSTSMDPKFGHEMRRHFLFDEKWTNLNHGAYGTCPKQVADVRFNLLQAIERAPDLFLRYGRHSWLTKSCERLAEYLHVPTDEIVMVGNATLGMTAVLRNLTFDNKDVILHFDTIYDAVEMTLRSMRETSPQIRIHQVDYGSTSTATGFPKTHQGICQSFISAVSQIEAEGFRVKVAVFETISSIPAVRLPFERLTQLCRDRDILSLIDGAHGIGQIPLDLAELDADFFVTNCHKWFSQRFLNQFTEQATADNTPSYCVPAALDFREEVCGGETAILRYCKDIAQNGADIIAQKLGTVVLQEPQTERLSGDGESRTDLRDCAMSNVLLPLTVHNSPLSDTTGIHPDNIRYVTSWMQKIMPAEYNTSVSFFTYRGRIWVRLSGQIYLEASDFEWFADILVDVCKRVDRGEPWAGQTKTD